MTRPSLALCMIVRNAAAELPRSLASARSGYDQLVIVDTGSTDGTVAAARAFGAEVHRFTSASAADGTLLDFARARNVATSHARTGWWWWMDADEVAAPGTVAALRSIASHWPRRAVLGVTDTGASRWYRARLAPHDGRHVWRGAVHEWLEAPDGVSAEPCLLFYHRPSPGRGQSSLLRNLRILRREIEAGRATPRETFYLARTLQSLGRGPEAARVWKDYMRAESGPSEHARFARLYLARQLLSLGNLEVAADHALTILHGAPRFAEAACLLGDIAAEIADAPLAMAWYRRALRSAPCPVGPLFHEPACFGAYPRARIERLERRRSLPAPRLAGRASGRRVA